MTLTEMHGKVSLVTGSTSGLGKATAFALAQQHATVILGCRSRQRGEAVRAAIKATSPAATVDVLPLDLAVLDAVRSAVSAFEQRYDHLDVLINNAAVFTRRRTLTPDGYETMFATNHLGPLVLTTLLLPRLRASPAARILTLTPPATMRIAVDEMHAPQPFRAMPAFRASKVATLLCTYELAHRLAGSSVTVNALYPGLVKTSLLREAPAPLRWLTALAGQPPEAVAPRVVYYASSPDVEGMTGVLFHTGRHKAAGPSPTDRTVGQHLWAASMALARLEDTGAAPPTAVSVLVNGCATHALTADDRRQAVPRTV